jgi:hypothetical protein
VAIVSAADTETLLLFRQGRSVGGQSVAILLEGFGRGEDPGAAAALSRAGLKVVTCNVGGLEEALASLTRILEARAPATRQAASAAGGRPTRTYLGS